MTAPQGQAMVAMDAAHSIASAPSGTSRRERVNRSERSPKIAISAARLFTRPDPSQMVDPELGLPHQSKGFAFLSAWLAESDDFMIFRRFGFLHARLLLDRQAKIQQLEQELENSGKIDDYLHTSHGRHSVPRLTDIGCPAR